MGDVFNQASEFELMDYMVPTGTRILCIQPGYTIQSFKLMDTDVFGELYRQSLHKRAKLLSELWNVQKYLNWSQQSILGH